jgi:hypothetical protein
MKLFITNKSYFEELFDDEHRFLNTNREPLNTRQIHKDLFNQLSISIDVENSIPLCLFTHYDKGEGIAIFDFITKKGDIYYYEFATTAS